MSTKPNPLITPRIVRDVGTNALSGLKTSDPNLRFIGLLYENERGEQFVSPKMNDYFYPTVLVPLRETGLQRCPEHGVVVSRCIQQHHAHRKPIE